MALCEWLTACWADIFICTVYRHALVVIFTPSTFPPECSSCLTRTENMSFNRRHRDLIGLWIWYPLLPMRPIYQGSFIVVTGVKKRQNHKQEVNVSKATTDETDSIARDAIPYNKIIKHKRSNKHFFFLKTCHELIG